MFDPVEGNVYANIAPEMVSTACKPWAGVFTASPTLGVALGVAKW